MPAMNTLIESLPWWGQFAVVIAPWVIAVFAWRTSTESLRASFRPVLRPVALVVKATGHVDPTRFVLKNIGRGPALGIQVFNYPGLSDTEPLGELDWLEPLGPPRDGSEESRPGRAAIQLAWDIALDVKPGTTYRVLYQDLAGIWQETHVTYGDRRIDVAYLGPQRWWHHAWGSNRRIPPAAEDRKHVIRPIES